jgi:hypothetical protein
MSIEQRGEATGMGSFSLGTAWEETIAFLRRESGLLIPVAMAIFAPAQILFSMGVASTAGPAGPVPAQGNGQYLLVLPALLLVVFGNLTVSLIALTPGISVREAMLRAVRRFPTALAAALLLAAAFIGSAVAIVVAATLGVMLFGADPQSPAISGKLEILIAIPMMVLMVRMLLLFPLLAVEKCTALEAVRRAWALSRDNFLRFAGVLALSVLLAMIVALLEYFVLGSLIGLIKLAVGDGELLGVVQMLLNAAIEAMLSMALAVFIAATYRLVAD